MLLFKPHHIEMIQDGRKTATRRDWKTARAKVGAVHLIKTKMLSTENHGQVEILNVYQERLGDMTTSEAEAEGYKTVEEYRAEWERINRAGSWDPDKRVFVVEFKYLPETAPYGYVDTTIPRQRFPVARFGGRS